MASADDFQALLEKIDAKERRSKWRILLFTGVSIAFAIVLVTYSSGSVVKTRQQAAVLNDSLSQLEEKRVALESELTNIRDSLQGWTRIIEKYDLDFRKFMAQEWDGTVCLNKSTEGLELSKLSHEKLIELLKGEKVDVLATVRYYIKRSEKGLLESSLRSSGFRSLYIDNDSYRSPRTNSIRYSPGIGRETVLAVAMATMRAGIELKGIAPYSLGVITKNQKGSSIELAFDETIKDAPSLTFTQVINLEYREE